MADNSANDSPYDFADPEPPKKPSQVPPSLQARKERPVPKPAAREQGELPLAPEPAPAPRAKPAPAETASAVDNTLRTCLHCGYSFRGKPKARCPECAGPMESASDLMQFADTGWVRVAEMIRICQE